MPSISQPGHGACVLAASGKLTYDSGILKKINIEHKRFGLPTIPELNTARVRIIVVILSQTFMPSCNSHEKLEKNLNNTHGKVDTTQLDEEKINCHDMSRFC